ncbi:hypothetical protein [Paenibacillus riograndensis]|uniref:Putative membrane protein n=1 Tax=Paenibacillus riograndensis SBR5 TaxID=1073571 RepID=A0A0E4HCR2_9BACL|nr:hypothetical protein [Paenibacillus riograndensis]CQR54710.1 putative membrane protein [Paenibacillus riograndensis SBR5]
MKSIKTVLQAILYVLLAVGLHLILIYFLKIRIEGWGTELLKYSFKVYFVPLLLCFINSFLCIRTKRLKYHVNWFLVTMIPSFLLILFFKAIQGVGDSEYGVVVSIEFFPKYQVEMLFLLPWSISIIQFILTLYYLIKIRKEVNRLKV